MRQKISGVSSSGVGEVFSPELEGSTWVLAGVGVLLEKLRVVGLRAAVTVRSKDSWGRRGARFLGSDEEECSGILSHCLSLMQLVLAHVVPTPQARVGGILFYTHPSASSSPKKEHSNIDPALVSSRA